MPADKNGPAPTFDEILDKATKRAFKGGVAGSAAAAVQVTSLMWIRTIMNYQYRYGTGLTEAFKVALTNALLVFASGPFVQTRGLFPILSADNSQARWRGVARNPSLLPWVRICDVPR